MKRDTQILIIMVSIAIFMVTLPFIMLLLPQPSNYDTEEEMHNKCTNLIGLNDLIINRTTIAEIYDKYDIQNITEKAYLFNPNINTNIHSEVKDHIEWDILTLDDILIDGHSENIELHFYRDTLIEIKYRYPNYDKKGNESKKFPNVIANKYGHGLEACEHYLDSISYNGKLTSSLYLGGRKCKYINGDINMVLSCDYWDVIIFHKPKLIELFSKISEVKGRQKSSTLDISTSSTKKYIKRGSENDEVYWNSIRREKMLKDAGMYDAARIEKNARQRYLQGGGYTAPDGSGQIHFQGSKEQEEQLRMMDELGW